MMCAQDMWSRFHPSVFSDMCSCRIPRMKPNPRVRKSLRCQKLCAQKLVCPRPSRKQLQRPTRLHVARGVGAGAGVAGVVGEVQVAPKKEKQKATRMKIRKRMKRRRKARQWRQRRVRMRGIQPPAAQTCRGRETRNERQLQQTKVQARGANLLPPSESESQGEGKPQS